MSTPSYDAIVAKVRSWANRDSSVLTDELIGNFLDYSADYLYRNLRIPPLEHTFDYIPITSGDVGETAIVLPSDLSELIQFSKTDSKGDTTVFEEKASLASMQDKDYTRTKAAFARKGKELLFYPEAELGDVYEVHYYRRLADLDATYTVNQVNLDAGLLTAVTSSTEGAVEFPASSGNYYIGKEVGNWLKDDNERILVWGALAHALEYVGEDERAEKFFNKQKEGILELNQEEIKRKARGGSIVASYAGVAQL